MNQKQIYERVIRQPRMEKHNDIKTWNKTKKQIQNKIWQEVGNKLYEQITVQVCNKVVLQLWEALYK